jgi:hypothetical protein
MATFRATVLVFREQELSQDALSKRLADATRRARDELIEQGKASPRYRTFVDGRESQDVDHVKTAILYEFDYLADAIGFLIGYLRTASPVASGRYRDSFMIAIDGRPVRATEFDPTKVPQDAEVIIYNPQPYSRKVDTQLIGTKRLHYDVPQWLFENAAAAARRRFGNRASIKRVYNVNFLGKYLLRREQRRPNGRIARKVGTPVESPCIVISPL